MGKHSAIIPVNRPRVPRRAKRYLDECVTTGWFSSEGPYVKKFEDQFARRLGVSYASATSSGTASLHLAIMALGIGKGDEVILPATTIASCFFAIWYTGAVAVPVDITPDTYTINPDLIEQAITKRTKAIMVVHLFGHPCDMDPIMKLAKKYSLAVIEDAAEAHGAMYKGKPVGSIGDIAIFSFYANKIVTTGEGGMVTSNNASLIEHVNRLKSLNHSKTRFIHNGIGYNYLMSNMQAAVGLASLEELEISLAQKRRMAKLYHTRLSDIPGLILPKEEPWAESVYWMYAVRINSKKTNVTRQNIMDRLMEKGIQTRTFFYSPSRAFTALKVFKNRSFPVAQEVEKTGFYLPSGLGNTKNEFIETAHQLHRCFSRLYTDLSH